jgi:transcriptional regulator with XRE-family HTH domain
METFGDRVKRLRGERGWSQETLAEKAATTSRYISDIENNRRPPDRLTVGIVERLAHAFDIHPRDLLYPADH